MYAYGQAQPLAARAAGHIATRTRARTAVIDKDDLEAPVVRAVAQTPEAIPQQHDAVLASLAVSHHDLLAVQVKVLHAQAAALFAPQSCSIEKAGHQTEHAVAPAHRFE